VNALFTAMVATLTTGALDDGSQADYVRSRVAATSLRDR
jgi:hypothetical protein